MLPPVIKQEHAGHEGTSKKEAVAKIRSEPVKQGASPLVDAEHDGDKHQDGYGLKDEATHALHHASVSARPKAAEVGLEFAAFNGATVAEATHTYDNALGIIVRLIDAEATTPADALALVAAAQTLMPQDNESSALILANALMLRAMRALELLSSTPARVFNASGPTLN